MVLPVVAISWPLSKAEKAGPTLKVTARARPPSGAVVYESTPNGGALRFCLLAAARVCGYCRCEGKGRF